MSKKRETAAFWQEQRRQFDRYAKRPLRHFEKYARWYAGDFAEIPYRADRRGDGALGEIDQPALANLTNLATRTFRGDLYCRNPRFLCRQPGSYNEAIFTPLLAKIETTLLNDAAEETHLYREMQLALLDFILAPYMVGRIGLGFESTPEEDLLRAQRDVARIEDQKYLMLGVKPRVKETDYHPEHIEQHEVTLAEWQRSGKVPEGSMRYLRKHIEKHWQEMPYCRLGETRRNQAVTFRRVNPLLYSFDVYPTTPGDRTWCGESFLMRIADAEENSEFSRKARDELSEVKQIYRTGDDAPTVRGQVDLKSPDPYFRAFEYIDHITGDIVTIAEHGTLPLLVKPWGHRDVLPSGPFIEASLLEHPLHNYGVSSPHIYARHQELASAIAEINSEVVLRSLPFQYADMRSIGTEEVGDVMKQRVAGIVPFKNLREGQDASKVIGNVEPVEIPQQNAAMESYHQAMIEKNNGGPARMGGGDRSATATASEVVSAANAILTDDAQAKMDEFLRQLGVGWTRLIRKYYDRTKVAEIHGDEALGPGGWPLHFATRDILQDRGTSIVPGSTRRNNDTIEAKILQQQIVTTMPLVEMGLVPPDFIMELLRRSNESLGVFALDYEGALRSYMDQQEAMLMGGEDPNAAMGGEGGMPARGPEGARMTEMEEPSAASQAQGQRNMGGGRAGRSGMRQERKQRESVRA